MKIDIKLPVIMLESKEVAEYFKSFLLNKSVNKPLMVSDIYGNLSYNGFNIYDCYGWTFKDLLAKIKVMKSRTGYYLKIPNPTKMKELEKTEVDNVTYAEPRVCVEYFDVETDDVWKVTSLHREETL